MTTPEPPPLPRVSLVTPNLDYGRHLPATLDSILGQSYPNLDYIVVDGGSRDDSVEIVRARGVRLLVEPGLGQYESINLGFAQTTGEIMGWLNSDDIHLPWTLRAVAGIFAAFPEVDWIMGAPAVIQAGVVQRVHSPRPFLREAIRLGLCTGADFGQVQQESCFWRRSLWEKAGPLRPECGLAADFELWTRFARHAELIACEALLGAFTRHAGNRSITSAPSYRRSVAGVIAGFSRGELAARAKLHAANRRYLRLRRWPGLKRLTRTLDGLTGLSAPVLRRDLAGDRYALVHEPVFP